jgi:hypothetical protein
VTRRHHFVLLIALATGCAGAAATPPRPAVQTFPGFDTGLYPGDQTMTAWRRPSSPYHWVGYYLAAPCHRDASWAGKRETLAGMGWGLAVLYVGQQTWEGSPDRAPAVDSTAARADTAQRPIVCSRTLLTAAQGTTDANDALAKAVAEGFPQGTQIFLDIERMTTIPQAMRDYYRAWVTRVLADGRFRPAIYAHGRNAAEIYADVRATFEAAGVRDGPSFWISAPAETFTVSSQPTEAGFAFARVWQGVVDVRQTWNGRTLRIDTNVADSPSPSAPRSGAVGAVGGR